MDKSRIKSTAPGVYHSRGVLFCLTVMRTSLKPAYVVADQNQRRSPAAYLIYVDSISRVDFQQNVLVYAYPNGGMTNNLTRHTHSGRANGAFLDGHAAGNSPAELKDKYGFEQTFGGQEGI